MQAAAALAVGVGSFSDPPPLFTDWPTTWSTCCSCLTPHAAFGIPQLHTWANWVQCGVPSAHNSKHPIYVCVSVCNLLCMQAAAALAVGVGSFSDPREFHGLAHYLEHMLFMSPLPFAVAGHNCTQFKTPHLGVRLSVSPLLCRLQLPLQWVLAVSVTLVNSKAWPTTWSTCCSWAVQSTRMKTSTMFT